MSLFRVRSASQQLPAAVILVAAILTGWFAYSPGITGSIQFDDLGTLGQLAFVDDSSNASTYILSGTAGPLGRPLSRATFLLEAHAWPSAPEVFLRTNILIHLLNGALVTWFLYLLGIARQQSERRSALIACSAGPIWMLMPILASSSLFIVQRMTTLSATFVLAGAIAYLYQRRAIDRHPILALAGMTLSLGLGVVLGALTKENGALLLVYMLAVELTLLSRPSGISRDFWRPWFSVVLVLPGILLLAYLATRLPYSEAIILRRDFTGLERLLTQAGVLWKYLYLSFLPNLPGLGPFHDDYPVASSILKFSTLLAVTSWAAVISLAVILRRKAPLFTFAVAWYLLGHSLESTTIHLEMYFEHRNYLPLVGPAYALVASILEVGEKWRRAVSILLFAYAIILAGVLFSVASLWGRPPIAAEMWYIYKPASIRAAQMLARQMEVTGNPEVALKVFREVREKNPEARYLDLQILLISCQIEPDKDYRPTMRSISKSLQTSQFDYALITLLVSAHNLVRQGKCPSFKLEDVYQFAEDILANPRYGAVRVKQTVRLTMAQLALDRGNFDLGQHHLDQALALGPDRGTLIVAVNILENAGMYDAAKQMVAEARDMTPRHPVRALLWRREIERLADEHEMLEANRTPGI